MNIRKLGIAAVAAVGIASAPTSAEAQFDRGMIETVAAILLADKLGLDPNMLMSLVGNDATRLGGGSLFDLAPVLLMGQRAPNADLADLISMRNRGMGWDVISDRAGLDSTEYQRLRASGQLDNNNVWRDTVIHRLRLPETTVTRLRNRGFNWRDIVLATVISRESRRPILDVANRYRATRSWNRTAGYYGVSRQRMANRIASWRTQRSIPSTWRQTSTGWVPPGLAKKGGLPPGQAKKRR
ncbi:MAG TPA: hypothetical protein VGE01_13030 [Fimbriimonas sp.]